MPQYEITAPDGRRFQVTAPDGATQSQVLAYAQQNYQSAGQPERTRLQKIEAALRAADAAGNVDDARRLAQAYADERNRTVGQETASIIVEGPDGQEIEFPHGTPRAVMERALQQHYGAPSQVRTPKKWTEVANSPAFQALSPEQQEAARAQYFDQVVAPQIGDPAQVQAARQQFDAQTGPRADFSNVQGGSDTVSAGPEPGYWQQRMHELRGVGEGARYSVAETALGIGQLVGGADEQDVQAFRQRKAQAQNRYGEAFTGGQFVGGALQTLGPAGAINRMRGVSALAGNAALGAGYAGAQPVAEGESRATNAAVGGAFGAGGHLGALWLGVLGRNAANAVTPEVRQMAQRAHELGIPLHASQVSQSLPVKVAASAGKYLPFSGYGKAASRQQEAVNRAVGQTFGADAPKLTDDVMERARRAMSQQFDAIYNRNAVPITEKGARRLMEVEREAARRLTNDEAQVLRNQFDDILANAEDGVLSGQKYQAVRTSLMKAEGSDKLGTAVRELRRALDDIAAESVGGQDAAALKALRLRWANFRVAEKALKQNAGAGGDIRPAALWPLIRSGSTREMRELARMGQTVLKDPISDSGTAQRTLLYNLLMGGGSIANPALIPLIAKAAAGGATIGRAANSSALARFLARSNRGQPTSRLADLARSATPYTAPAAAADYNRGGGR